MEGDSRPPKSSAKSLQSKSAKSSTKSPVKSRATKTSKQPAQAEKSSFVEAFRNEWSLFWDGLTGGSDAAAEFGNLKVEPMTMAQIKDITKNLSTERMKLNQKLEHLHREIELNATKAKSMNIVGLTAEDVEKRLAELHDQGQRLSEELAVLDARLRWVRTQTTREKAESLLG